MGFAARLAQEGHDVRMWIRNPDARSVGDGFVTKAGDFEDLFIDADTDTDCFIFDGSGNGVYADFLRLHNFGVIGGSVLADRLERDRSFGYLIMEDAGIKIPESRPFTSFDDAVQFVEQNPDTRWVYKPSKQLGDLSPSHVSYDSEDLIEMLRGIESEVDLAEPQFELQAFEKGIAFSTELWFQSGELLPLSNHTLERKELMDGDIGPSGGCLGNVVWFCEDCRVCRTVKRLSRWAKENRFNGMLDLNVIISERDGAIYGLEFTPRFGYDASPTLLFELLGGKLGRFFNDIAHERLVDIETHEGFAGAVRVTLPPWPTEKYTAEAGVPIRGIDDGTLAKHTYWYNVKRADASNIVSAGAWGIVCLFTGHGGNPKSALARPLEAAKELKLKNKQYRTDLAKRFEEDLDKLEELDVKVNFVEA